MESLSYSFEGTGLPFTDDIELSMDSLVRSRNLLKGWDVETLPIPTKDIFEDLGFLESGLPKITRMPLLSTQCLENPFDDANCDPRKPVPPTSVQDLVLSSEGPLESGKRTQFANVQSRIPVCIVCGCNKDLSSSKDYHKKHKVCDIHSKTAVVMVNGIQQRFCQQCSRFHILAAFDYNKRSCRKRLAGHNKRRRKPQLDTHFDSTFYGTDMSTSSLFSSKDLPGSFFVQPCSEPSNISRHSNAPLKSGCLLPKSHIQHRNEMGRHYPSKNCPNSPLSVLQLSAAASNSSCALSLLSAQSKSSSNDSAGVSIPTDCPLIFDENDRSNLALDHNSKKFRRIFSSSSSGEADERVLDELSQESGGNILDLLQLSLHLQRVEHQKHSHSMQVEEGSRICK